ncbi:MAG: putative rane protein, partial [Deltaproteobacteria bacterium]|nr:putative rane protein [Deltaproteobacteria bacterium]
MAKVAQRYIAWIERHVTAILVVATLAVLGATYLVMFELPLRADFSYLLPKDAPSVRAAEQLAGRMPEQDTMLMLIVAPVPAMRETAATQALAGLATLDKDLMERVDSDDADVRDFIAAHRHLFAPLAELEAARDALATHIAAAKQRANPLFVDLDDPDPAPPAALDEMRAKQREAAAKLAKPAYISADGRTQVIILRTAFRATDVARDLRLMGSLDQLATRIQLAHPGTTIGFAGGPVVTVAEHGALTRGILLSSVITFVLV